MAVSNYKPSLSFTTVVLSNYQIKYCSVSWTGRDEFSIFKRKSISILGTEGNICKHFLQSLYVKLLFVFTDEQFIVMNPIEFIQQIY